MTWKDKNGKVIDLKPYIKGKNKNGLNSQAMKQVGAILLEHFPGEYDRWYEWDKKRAIGISKLSARLGNPFPFRKK